MTHRITRPHLPSMLLGAVLGTASLSVAGPRLFAEADTALQSARVELRQVDAVAQRLHPRDAHRIRGAVARVDAAHEQLAVSLDQAHTRIQRLRDRALTAEQSLASCQAPPVRPPHGPPGRPQGYGPPVVSPQDLAALVHALDDATFARNQLALLRDMLPGRHFTVSQAMRLVEVFSFDRDKVQAATLLYPSIVDPDQWYRMYGTLSFSSSQRDLRARTSG